MWSNNTWEAKIEGGDQLEVFKLLLNVHENIPPNVFFRNEDR